MLFNDPRMNVPREVRVGVIEALGLALNVRNRANKKVKFGFSTSEDALTWTVFRHLHETGTLLNSLRRAGLPIPDGAARPEALLLWGVPIPPDRAGDDRGWRLRARLESIADRLGENPNSRTEPDVVIDLGEAGIFIVEVKHRSPTDVKAAGYGGWDRYYPAGSPLPYAASVRRLRLLQAGPELAIRARTRLRAAPALHAGLPGAGKPVRRRGCRGPPALRGEPAEGRVGTVPEAHLEGSCSV